MIINSFTGSASTQEKWHFCFLIAKCKAFSYQGLIDQLSVNV